MADRTTTPSEPGAPTRPESDRTARLADSATTERPMVSGFVAPGGTGAGELLSAISRRVASRGGTPLRITGRRMERDYPLGGLDDILDIDGLRDANPGTVDAPMERRCRDLLLDRLAAEGDAMLLVEDAQWLDDATLRVLVGATERAADRNVSIVVAHRPAQGDPRIAALDAALARHRPLGRLGPLNEADVAERAALIRGSAADPAFVEALHEQSAGVQDLVDRLVQAWDPRTGRPTTASDDGDGDALDPAIVEAVRTEIDQLPESTRTVLTATSAGADLDDDLLSNITGLGRQELTSAIESLRSAGLLVTGSDEVVPAVAAAVMQLTSVAERRRFHAALADALATRGAPPTRAAEHLAAAGAQGKDAAETYIAAGDACLTDGPELARAWFDRAAAAGAPAADVAPRQAEAAALDGDTEHALQLADAALNDPFGPDRARALGVVAALLPGRGFWGRAATTYDELRTDQPAVADVFGLIGRVVTGATERLPPPPEPPPSSSLEVEALTLTARGILASLEPDAAEAETPFLEAAELLESGHNRLLLPDSPHALGATVALALCQLNAAEHLLTRALERDVGGRSLRTRHQLLFGWVAVRRGRWSVAEATLAETARADLAPRELLLVAAIEAGLARRAGDLTRLGDAWRRAEGALLRHPADVLTIDALGELSIAASRLGIWEQVAGKAREMGNVLRTLGDPPLWVLPLRWTGLQVALAADDHDAVARRAAEVTQVRPVHPRLQALADAAEVWVEIMDGDVDPTRVGSAARGLQDLSLTWEASRLTGQAAIRSGDPTVTRSLLEQARDLKATLPSSEADQAPTAAGILSEREQMVAQHIADGLTYKEVGAQLYISPKTVEHHVAKIRQKLGATTRAEMLAALRSELSA